MISSLPLGISRSFAAAVLLLGMAGTEALSADTAPATPQEWLQRNGYDAGRLSSRPTDKVRFLRPTLMDYFRAVHQARKLCYKSQAPDSGAIGTYVSCTWDSTMDVIDYEGFAIPAGNPDETCLIDLDELKPAPRRTLAGEIIDPLRNVSARTYALWHVLHEWRHCDQKHDTSRQGYFFKEADSDRYAARGVRELTGEDIARDIMAWRAMKLLMPFLEKPSLWAQQSFFRIFHTTHPDLSRHSQPIDIPAIEEAVDFVGVHLHVQRFEEDRHTATIGSLGELRAELDKVLRRMDRFPPAHPDSTRRFIAFLIETVGHEIKHNPGAAAQPARPGARPP